MKTSTSLLLAIHELVDNMGADFEDVPGCGSIYSARLSNKIYRNAPERSRYKENSALAYFYEAFGAEEGYIGYWFMVDGMPVYGDEETGLYTKTYDVVDIHPNAQWYPTTRYVYAARICYMRKAYRLAIERGD